MTIFGCIIFCRSQGVTINANANPADNIAMLDISSYTKGVLIQRIRTIERTAMPALSEGLFVYDTDTRSFWYYTNGTWMEIPNTQYPFTPMGIAGGDLSGSYPTPNVSKIQNLDVSIGIPYDKQVMKWDGLNNCWQGLNDSLFLPYNVAYGSPTNLFGITNNNTTIGSCAMYGRNGSVGSGFSPAFATGVWGDNANGAGLLGSSNSNVGVYGTTNTCNSVWGRATGNNSSAIHGSNYGLNS